MKKAYRWRSATRSRLLTSRVRNFINMICQEYIFVVIFKATDSDQYISGKLTPTDTDTRLRILALHTR